MNKNVGKLAAKDKRLKGTHLRVYMILSLCGPLMQTEISDLIMVKKQNLTKVVRELEQWGYIDLYKIEGKNKFYRAATNDERIEQILVGQQDMFCKIK